MTRLHIQESLLHTNLQVPISKDVQMCIWLQQEPEPVP